MPLSTTPQFDVRLELVGEFVLRGVGSRVLPVGPAGQRLLAYLAIAGRPVQRSVVAGLLSLDGKETDAAARLRSALWRLPRAGGRPLVEATARRVCLSESIRVDYREAEYDVAYGRGSLNRLSADLLPDWDEDWVVVERERFRQARLHALERLCARYRDTGDYARSLAAGLAAVGGEPLRESAHRELIATHLAEGNPAEALRQYGTFRGLLRRELGLSPSPAIRGMVGHLLGRPVEDRYAPKSAVVG